MTDNITNTVEETDQNGTQVGIKALQITEDALEKFLSAADVGSAYGDVVTQGKTLTIPAAEVTAYLGVWLGGNVSANGKEAAGGSGGVGKVTSRPVNVIFADEQGMEVKPLIDMTRIIRGAMTTLGFIAVCILVGRRK